VYLIPGMLYFNILLRRHSNTNRSKDLTLVHIKGGGLSSRLYSNEGKAGGLVNSTKVSADEVKVNLPSLETNVRSVEFYKINVNLTPNTLARAKIHLKNGSSITGSFVKRNTYAVIIVVKGICLGSNFVVNLPTNRSITELNCFVKPENYIYRITSIVKTGHPVKHLIGDRALQYKKSVISYPLY